MTVAVNLVNPYRFANFTPDTVAGLKFWGAADGANFQDSARTTPTASDGDPVGSLSDKSGAGNHVLQATDVKRPLYKTNILGGKPVLRFDAVDDTLRGTFTVGAQPNTLFLVANRRVASSGTNWYMADGATLNEAIIRGQTAWDIYAGSSVIGTGAVDANPHIFVATFNGASSKIRVDGGAGAGGNAGAVTPTGLSLGAGGSGAGSFFLDGDIAEAILYNAAVSLTDINAIGMYLAAKYGLTWTTAT